MNVKKQNPSSCSTPPSHGVRGNYYVILRHPESLLSKIAGMHKDNKMLMASSIFLSFMAESHLLATRENQAEQ